MTQLVRSFATKPDDMSSNPQDPRKSRRKLASASCLLTSRGERCGENTVVWNAVEGSTMEGSTVEGSTVE